ncbi:FG-GAP repeat protein [bacterium]|nr:FG-GAP repeat protein [bacterium]
MHTLPRTPPLGLEPLEPRDVPAVNIVVDYSFDASGFFADPARRAVAEQAAADLGSRLGTPLAAVTPGGNTWTEFFTNPATGGDASVRNATLAADTLTIYVGARELGGSTVGEGGPGTYSASGTSAWRTLLRGRAPSGVTAWGGGVAFDSSTNWFFGASPAGLGRTQTDFYSVAVHEFGHVLGIGTSSRWLDQVSGGTFVGPNAEAVYGGPVPVTADGGHWRDGTTVNGVPASLDPTTSSGTRVTFSALDFAALEDLGWAVGTSTAPAPVSTTQSNPRPWTGTWTSLAFFDGVVVLSGATAGTAQAFALATDGTLVAVGPVVTPFVGNGGALRSAVGDFNGDGTPDLALGTGVGATAAVRVFNGRTGADLGELTTVLGGFGGGVYLAAGDLDGDGRDELAVSADAGGGTRVTVLRLLRTFSPVADFIALDDPNFRGGSRVAIGDVDGDGAADLIVGAGVGGGPRVAVYAGGSVLAGSPAKLVPDFFALDSSLRSGVFITAADLDGDGFAELAYGTGTTGGPRVRVVSGALLVANPGRPADALPAVADFFAFDPNDRSGLRVAGRDLDGDGAAELVVGSGAPGAATARVLTLATLATAPQFNPFPDVSALDGVYVG